MKFIYWNYKWVLVQLVVGYGLVFGFLLWFQLNVGQRRWQSFQVHVDQFVAGERRRRRRIHGRHLRDCQQSREEFRS